MNIFVLSETYCPIESAKFQCDTHIVSQSKESVQILSNCFSLDRLSKSDCPRTQKGSPRKHSYPNHPCSKWARASTSNMDWLIFHAQAQFEEFTFRNKKRHFSQDFLDWVIKNIEDAIVSDGELTEFPVAINESKNCRKVEGFDEMPRFEQYRLYYKLDKPFSKWERGRNKPEWMVDER